jgi:hypothetical protein
LDGIIIGAKTGNKKEWIIPDKKWTGKIIERGQEKCLLSSGNTRLFDNYLGKETHTILHNYSFMGTFIRHFCSSLDKLKMPYFL